MQADTQLLAVTSVACTGARLIPFFSNPLSAGDSEELQKVAATRLELLVSGQALN